jgi:hypothetical protein
MAVLTLNLELIWYTISGAEIHQAPVALFFLIRMMCSSPYEDHGVIAAEALSYFLKACCDY